MRYRATPEGNVPFTAEENAEWDALQASYEANAPAREAKAAAEALRNTDMHMARVVEDIYSVLTAEQKAALPQAAKDKIAERQALRAKL